MEMGGLILIELNMVTCTMNRVSHTCPHKNLTFRDDPAFGLKYENFYEFWFVLFCHKLTPPHFPAVSVMA